MRASSHRVLVADTPDEAAALAAKMIARELTSPRASTTRHLALAGGTTPRQSYRLLTHLIDDWRTIELWLGDERMVPPDAADANARLVRESLLEPAAIAADHFHPVPTHLPVAAAAAAYGDEIAATLAPDPCGLPRFDVVMLGLGEDAHVASLFPAASTLTAGDVCVPVVDAPKPPPQRISLSLPVINAARCRIVLATGTAKARALTAALGEPTPTAPASLLRRDGTVFVVDAAARDAPERD